MYVCLKRNFHHCKEQEGETEVEIKGRKVGGIRLGFGLFLQAVFWGEMSLAES